MKYQVGDILVIGSDNIGYHVVLVTNIVSNSSSSDTRLCLMNNNGHEDQIETDIVDYLVDTKKTWKHLSVKS